MNTKYELENTKSSYPKVLVISHNVFSSSGSNGRTLANFFESWPKELLAQFYISNELPDTSVCNNYFRVRDSEVLESFIKGTKAGKEINSSELIDEKEITEKKIYLKPKKKKPINYLLRNLIWDSKRWESLNYKNWINDFNPDVILLQLGDYSFMLRIALGIAKKRKIPIVIYNSEDYYFKDNKSFSLLYHTFRRDYKKEFKKIISNASHTIYNSKMLQETHQKEFKHNSSVIMTSTDIEEMAQKKQNSNLKISYLGNLGLGRYQSLIEIAQALYNINNELRVEVYGKSPSQEITNALNESSGIRFKGFIPYDEVKRVMNDSDILIHTENFDEFYKNDLKHAFSTKIADSLASGKKFFVYAPENLAFTKYLMENEAAYVVTEKEKLDKSLRFTLNDDNKYKVNAIKLATENHNKEKNKMLFQKTLKDIYLYSKEKMQ